MVIGALDPSEHHLTIHAGRFCYWAAAQFGVNRKQSFEPSTADLSKI